MASRGFVVFFGLLALVACAGADGDSDGSTDQHRLVDGLKSVLNPFPVVTTPSPTPPASPPATASATGQPGPATDLTFLTETQAEAPYSAPDFSGLFAQNDSVTAYGHLSGLAVNNHPVLATLPGDGVSQNLVTLEACAVNQPHTHPRGTEISHITEGELFFGFVEGNAALGVGGRFISGNFTKGETVIIPQGLMHFAQNLGCQQAQFIATFPNRDAGTQQIASNFFPKLPIFTLRATLGLGDAEIMNIQAAVESTCQKNPSADPVCLKACGLPVPVTLNSC